MPDPLPDRSNVSAADDEGQPAADLDPRRDAAVIVIGVAGAAAVWFGHRSSPVTAVALVVMVAISTWLAVIDFRLHRLPNRIVGPLALAATITVAIGAWVTDDWNRALTAIGLGVALAGLLLGANLTGGLGMGDVKYGYPVGVTVGWFGFDPLIVTVLATTVAGAVFAVAMLVAGRGRSHRLAYGPFMALGTIVGLLTAAPW